MRLRLRTKDSLQSKREFNDNGSHYIFKVISWDGKFQNVEREDVRSLRAGSFCLRGANRQPDGQYPRPGATEINPEPEDSPARTGCGPTAVTEAIPAHCA